MNFLLRVSCGCALAPLAHAGQASWLSHAALRHKWGAPGQCRCLKVLCCPTNLSFERSPRYVVCSRSPPPAPSSGAAVTATSGETLDTLPLPPEQVSSAETTSASPCCCLSGRAYTADSGSVRAKHLLQRARVQMFYCRMGAGYTRFKCIHAPCLSIHPDLVSAQTPGRRSNSDPVPDPSEDPLPYVSRTTSAALMSARSDATGRSSSIGAVESASSGLPSDLGGNLDQTARAGGEAAKPLDASNAEEATAEPSPAASATDGQPSEPATEGRAEAAADPSGAANAAERQTVAGTAAMAQLSLTDDAPTPEHVAPAAAALDAAAAEPSAAGAARSRTAGQTEAEATSAAGVALQNGRAAPPGDAGLASGGASTLNMSAAAAEALTGGAEGEHSPQWQRQSKHVFVLTSAGAGGLS